MKKNRNQLLSPISGHLGQYLIGFFILLTSIAFSIFYVWEAASSPFTEARQHAQTAALQYAQLSQVTDIAIYNGQETYYSVQGKDKAGVAKLVLIPEVSGTIRIFDLESGISEEEANAVAKENGAGAVDRAIIGYLDDKPIWEVKSGTAYYLIEFETGNFIKKEGL